MKKEIFVSDIKDMSKVFAGITYASNGYKPTDKYKDDEEFMIGYRLSSNLCEKSPAVIKGLDLKKKTSRKCK